MKKQWIIIFFVLGFILAACSSEPGPIGPELQKYLDAQATMQATDPEPTPQSVEVDQAANLACRGTLLAEWGDEDPRFNQGFNICHSMLMAYVDTLGHWPGPSVSVRAGIEQSDADLFSDSLIAEFIKVDLLRKDQNNGPLKDSLKTFLGMQRQAFNFAP